MRRFSIRTLMAFIVVGACGLAALRYASDLWGGILLLAALTATGTAILGVVNCRGRERSWCQGFALFSGVYLILIFGPWAPDNFQSKLGTAPMLRTMYNLKFQTPYLPKQKLVKVDMRNNTSKTTWVTPTKPSYEHFQRVGHSLFAILAGFVGGTIAIVLRKRSEGIDGQ
jgi:hypothetical protein